MATINTENWDETCYHRVGRAIVYFVKDGNLNGVEGVVAHTIGTGEQEKDGLYYMLDGEENGTGPFITVDAVLDAAQEESHYGF